VFQLRVKSGGVAGQMVSHGIAATKVGLFEPPHALTA
jgi:hypothetical protein